MQQVFSSYLGLFKYLQFMEISAPELTAGTVGYTDTILEFAKSSPLIYIVITNCLGLDTEKKWEWECESLDEVDLFILLLEFTELSLPTKILKGCKYMSRVKPNNGKTLGTSD